jgi:TniQ
MEAERQAIWKVLPLRPRPEVLESMTSYLTRLAEANGFQSIDELGDLAGGMRRLSSWKSPDYPNPPYSSLVQITGVPTAGWLRMTFFHLIQHFGYSLNRLSLHKFLAGSLAPSLRYCPICLDEQNPASYSLLWRFLRLPGCALHRVHFLHQCGHCQFPLPLLGRHPQLTRCPTCQGDLRRCLSSPLGGSDLESTVELTHDLKMLLTRMPRQKELEQAKLIGKRFQILRLRQDLLIPEVAHLLGLSPSVIRDIDYVARSRKASLNDYMRYANLLGYSLREIFDEASLQELLVPKSEQQVFDQVEAAIRQLETRGQPILPGSVGELLGIAGSRLKQYPRVKKLLSRHETQRKQELPAQEREDELVKLVEQTLSQLEERSEPIILQHVCDLVGVNYAWIAKKYPRVKALLHEHRKNRSGRCSSPHLDEEEKVQRVQAAINWLVSHGELVTLRRIRQRARLTPRQLERSPRVKALLAQHARKWQRATS